jgi:hypothetical protein
MGRQQKEHVPLQVIPSNKRQRRRKLRFNSTFFSKIHVIKMHAVISKIIYKWKKVYYYYMEALGGKNKNIIQLNEGANIFLASPSVSTSEWS